MSSPTYLVYADQLPPGQLEKYPYFQTVFQPGQRITTRLPKSTALIRTAVAIVMGWCGIAISNSSFLGWPVATAILTFAGWTVYSQFIKKDPLIEALSQIVGGKEKFEKLPQISVSLLNSHSNSLCEGLTKINWDQLHEHIYKIKLLDGRNIVLIKAYTKKQPLCRETDSLSEYAGTKTVVIFLERFGAKDHSLPETRLLGEIQDFLGFARSSFLNDTYKIDHDKLTNTFFMKEWEVTPTLSSDVANVLMAQLNRSSHK